MYACRLKRYCSDTVPVSVRVATAYAWLTSFSIVVLVPLDVYTTLMQKPEPAIGVMWNISYWSTQVRMPSARVTSTPARRWLAGCILRWLRTLASCSSSPEPPHAAQVLTWLLLPFFQVYADAGDFSVGAR